MTFRFVFRPVAQDEFDKAAEWYESQRSGLGIDFVSEVRRVLHTILSQPDRYPIASTDVREAPVSRFPYCVYYRVKPSRIVVLGVVHTSRDPSAWQSRA